MGQLIGLDHVVSRTSYIPIFRKYEAITGPRFLIPQDHVDYRRQTRGLFSKSRMTHHMGPGRDAFSAPQNFTRGHLS